jgi:hypothetical protein
VKIKLSRNYSTYRVGTVIDCDEETAGRLLQDGTAEKIETASIDPPVERADHTPRRVRRAAISKPKSPE